MASKAVTRAIDQYLFRRQDMSVHAFGGIPINFELPNKKINKKIKLRYDKIKLRVRYLRTN